MLELSDVFKCWIKDQKGYTLNYMKNLIIILALSIALVSCAGLKEKGSSVKEKLKLERKACVDGEKKTLTDLFCKKN